jgi:L-threonylcarbamoyladenylate synthase
MNIIKIGDKGVMDEVVSVFRDGGLVMHPTETCYGLAVDVFNEEALKKLYKFKEMGFDKPVSILVDGFGMADEYGIFSDKAYELAERYWPGALSIVVPRKRSLPDFLNKGIETVSFRYSSDDFSNEMVKVLGKPVSTTSANKTGEPQLYKVDISGWGDEIDLIVDGGELIDNKPSTIVKVEGDKVEVLRQGELLCEDI